MKNEKIVILSPTEPEIAPFRYGAADGTEIRITGVGPYRCAVATMAAVRDCNPQLLILAGIAGAYPGSGLSVGQTVLVASECAADAGSFVAGDFTPKFSGRYDCPWLPAGVPFRAVDSNSVGVAGTPFADRVGVQIENMEGAAFFYACLQCGVPFLELRAVSNRVGDPFPEWDVRGAVTALADSLCELLHFLNTERT